MWVTNPQQSFMLQISLSEFKDGIYVENILGNTSYKAHVLSNERELGAILLCLNCIFQMISRKRMLKKFQISF